MISQCLSSGTSQLITLDVMLQDDAKLALFCFILHYFAFFCLVLFCFCFRRRKQKKTTREIADPAFDFSDRD